LLSAAAVIFRQAQKQRKTIVFSGTGGVGRMSNMPAELLLDERHVLSQSAFVELGVWRAPAPVRGSQHELRYRLALVVDGDCVLRYDNEAGKGDHWHMRDKEHEYRFKNAGQLLADFWKDVEETPK
jgi:Family of unknown function (DUF6516)